MWSTVNVKRVRRYKRPAMCIALDIVLNWMSIKLTVPLNLPNGLQALRQINTVLYIYISFHIVFCVQILLYLSHNVFHGGKIVDVLFWETIKKNTRKEPHTLQTRWQNMKHIVCKDTVYIVIINNRPIATIPTITTHPIPLQNTKRSRYMAMEIQVFDWLEKSQQMACLFEQNSIFVSKWYPKHLSNLWWKMCEGIRQDFLQPIEQYIIVLFFPLL